MRYRVTQSGGASHDGLTEVLVQKELPDQANTLLWFHCFCKVPVSTQQYLLPLTGIDLHLTVLRLGPGSLIQHPTVFPLCEVEGTFPENTRF